MPALTPEDITKGKELAAAWQRVVEEVEAKPELLERSPNLASYACWMHTEQILLGQYYGNAGGGLPLVINWLAARGYTEGACLKQFVEDCVKAEVTDAV